MKRAVFALCLITLAWSLSAQDADNLTVSYQRNFVRSSLGTKLDLLKEASQQPTGGMGPLYEQALQFVLDNYALLRNDGSLRDLGILAVQSIDHERDAQAIPLMLQLFQSYRETGVRVPVVQALGDIGTGNGQAVEFLNTYLANQNNIYKTGTIPDLDTIKESIVALGKLGDGSSFGVLFSTMVTGFNDEGVTRSAQDSLARIKGDYKKYLIDVIRKNPVNEKLAALRAGFNTDKFSPAETAEIAEAGLDMGLNQPAANGDEAKDLRDMRYAAVQKLIVVPWPKASPLAVRHFNVVQTDFARNEATRQQLLDAIACLGAMGTSDAAQALSLYLGLLNAQVEQGKNYDEEIVLSVVSSLGRLGDKAAFDYLLYIGYLNYSDTVKKAAKDALGVLKW
jgi:HEAT repeat protein